MRFFSRALFSLFMGKKLPKNVKNVTGDQFFQDNMHGPSDDHPIPPEPFLPTGHLSKNGAKKVPRRPKITFSAPVVASCKKTFVRNTQKLLPDNIRQQKNFGRDRPPHNLRAPPKKPNLKKILKNSKKIVADFCLHNRDSG